jgi:hypothetical protein
MAKKKLGPKNVNPSSKGKSPTHVVAGGPGGSFSQMPFPGPASPGPPASMRKALAKKSGPRGRATGYAGSLRPNG